MEWPVGSPIPSLNPVLRGAKGQIGDPSYGPFAIRLSRGPGGSPGSGYRPRPRLRGPSVSKTRASPAWIEYARIRSPVALSSKRGISDSGPQRGLPGNGRHYWDPTSGPSIGPQEFQRADYSILLVFLPQRTRTH